MTIAGSPWHTPRGPNYIHRESLAEGVAQKPMRCGGVHELELVPTAATIDLEIGKVDETRRWELRVRAGENCPRGSRFPARWKR